MSVKSNIGIKIALEGAAQTQADLKKVQDGLGGLSLQSEAVKGALGALAGVITVSALSAWVKSSIDAADEVSKLGQRAGIATEQVAGLQLAFQQAGVGDAFATSMAKLGKAVADNNPALAAMGINVRTASGALLGTREALAAVADKFASYADGTEKVALAQELLGKSGAQLIPLLNGGAQGLADYDEKAQALGLTLSGETAKAAEQFNDTLDLISQKTKGAGLQLATGLLPVLNVLAKEFQASSEKGAGFEAVGSAISTVLETVTVLGSDVAFVFKSIGTEIGGIAAQAAALVNGGGLSGAAAIREAMVADAASARAELDRFQDRVLRSKEIKAQADEINGTASARLARQSGTGEKSFAPVVTGANAAAKAVKELGDEFASQREAAKGWADAMGDFAKMQHEAEASGLGLSKAQARLVDYLGSTAYTNASEPMQQLALAAAYAAINAEQLDEATKAQTAAQAAALANSQAYTDSLDQQTIAAYKAVEAAQWQLDTFGLSQEAIASLTLSRLEDARAQALLSALTLDDVRAIDAQIDAQKRLVSIAKRTDVLQAASDTAKDAAAEWKRASDQIESSITDALMRGFESGKGFAVTLRDTIANLFKTLVLRPIVSAVVNPVAQAITGTLGVSSAANAGTSALSAAGNAASVANLFGGSGALATVSGAFSGFTTALTAGVQSLAGVTGTTAQMVSSLTAAGHVAAPGVAAGVGAGNAVLAAAPYVAAAVAALAAIGAFRTTKQVGGGLTGTLGEGDINSYALNRKSGYLFGGPDYSIADKGVAEQSAALQKAFTTSRTAMVSMADTLGLGSDAIKAFTTSIGKDLIHPDTGGLGLKLDGLTAEQASAKVQAALEGANEEMAKTVLAASTLTGWMARLAAEQTTATATLQVLVDYPNKLLQAAGTSRDALVQTFASGLLTGDAAGAGQSVANQLVASIEQSMLGNAAGQIFDIVNRGIVTPVLDAMLQGQSITEALSQASLDATIAAATAKAQALGAIFNDPKFVQAMAALQTGLGSVLGNVGGALNFTPQYQAATVVQTVAGPSAADTAAASQLKSLQDEERQLRIQEAQAFGDTATELALLTAGMSDFEVELFNSNRSLKANIDAQQRVNALKDDAKQLQIDLLEAQGNHSAALALTTANMGEAERAQYLYNDSLRQQISLTKTATQLQVESLTSLRNSLVGINTTAQGNTNAAVATLERSVAAQRKALETSKTAATSLVADVKNIFDTLKTNVSDLYSQVGSTAQGQAAQGQQFITAALAAAKATGALPDGKALADAIGNARKGLDGAVYATQAEADFAKLVLAGELKDLQGISGDQLSTAEQQLKATESSLLALDDTLQAARDQIDVMRGVDISVLKVETAVEKLAAAILVEKQTAANVKAAAIIGTGSAIYNNGTGAGLNAGGEAFNGAAIKQAAVDHIAGGGSPLAIYDTIKNSGFTGQQAEQILGLASGTLAAEVDKINAVFGLSLPRLATGTNYVPQDMVAMLHQGEAVVPRVYNPAANPGFGGGNTERLERLVEGLTAEVQRLQALQAEGNTHTATTRDILDNVTEGGNAIRSDVVATVPAA